MLNETNEAILWITRLLERLDIPFQITGGLAAIAYGSRRKLYDIDLDIPDAYFGKLQTEIQKHLVFGPKWFEDENMSLFLMTAKFSSQLIDIGGGSGFNMFNQQTSRWEACPTDFSIVEWRLVGGLRLPIMPLKNLIFYKKTLGREVDHLDLEQITGIV